MNYRITGTVITGNSIGRHIGFPTANIALGTDEGIPDGVYAGVVTLGQGEYPALVNVGRNPSIGRGLPRKLEVHLLGFSGDLYGQRIEVLLVEHIRDEIKFDTIDELRSQIARDKQTIESYFSNYNKSLFKNVTEIIL